MLQSDGDVNKCKNGDESDDQAAVSSTIALWDILVDRAMRRSALRSSWND
jgi:hypothetical protein